MKRMNLMIMLAVCAVALSACATTHEQESIVTTVSTHEWAASDTSIHNSRTAPLTNIETRAALANESLVFHHCSIDDITLIEIYGNDSKMAPIMFFLHEHEGQKEQFLDEAISYAQSGFFCVLMDLYGYGERTSSEPVESIQAAVMCTSDIDLVLEYYRLSPFADSDRFVLYGQSMGGSAVWHYAAYGKKQPQAIVVCSAAADFTQIEDMGAVLDGKGQPPTWSDQQYSEYCNAHNPVASLEKIATVPMLVYQGMMDSTIPPSVTQSFEKQVAAFNSDQSTFIYDPNGGHNATIAFLNRIMPFLRQQVRIS